MKVVVSFDNRVRPDSTGVHILNGFRQLGYEVFHVLPERIMGVLPGEADLFVKVDDGLRHPIQWNADLHPSHYYCIDTHIETDWRLKLAKDGEFDTVSVVHKQGLSLPWHTEAYWLPVGCDPEVNYVGQKEKKYDVCFIGNFHSQFAQKRLDAVDVLFKNFPNFFHGHRTFKEMAEKFAQSKIVFNHSLNNDINMRFFEGMSSGSCLVTDHIDEIAELGLKNGVHYHAYRNMEEMVDLVRFLLDNDDIRERTALEGRKEVNANHTYSARCKKIVEMSKTLVTQ